MRRITHRQGKSMAFIVDDSPKAKKLTSVTFGSGFHYKERFYILLEGFASGPDGERYRAQDAVHCLACLRDDGYCVPVPSEAEVEPCKVTIEGFNG